MFKELRDAVITGQKRNNVRVSVHDDYNEVNDEIPRNGRRRVNEQLLNLPQQPNQQPIRVSSTTTVIPKFPDLKSVWYNWYVRKVYSMNPIAISERSLLRKVHRTNQRHKGWKMDYLL